MARREGIRPYRCVAFVAAALASLALAGWASAALVVNHPSFAGNISDLRLNGGAERVGSVLRLTDASEEQTSSVWTDRKVVRTRRSFKARFRFLVNDAEDVAFYGFAFVVHGRGPGALGAGGPGLGYGGIGESVAVEFDLSGSDAPGDPPGPGAMHVAITRNGDPGDQPSTVPYTVYSVDTNALVKYNARRHRIALFAAPVGSPLPSEPTISRQVNLRRIAGRRARAGFTGSTGVGGSTQELRSFVLKQRR